MMKKLARAEICGGSQEQMLMESSPWGSEESEVDRRSTDAKSLRRTQEKPALESRSHETQTYGTWADDGTRTEKADKPARRMVPAGDGRWKPMRARLGRSEEVRAVAIRVVPNPSRVKSKS